MATRHHNISGELTTTLLAAGDKVNVSKISLTNIHASTMCTVDLYIEKKLTGKFYLLKAVELPVGATLIYDDTKFKTTTGEFSLYVKLTDGDTFTLTGAIDPIASTTITGVGTSFLSEVSAGDEILVSSETRTVATITSDTTLTVTEATTDTANDTTPDCNPTALVDIIIN